MKASAQLARQTVLNTGLTYAGLVLGFVNVAVLYPRFLPDDEFGLTRLLVSVATIGGAMAQFGLDNTIVRYFPYFRDPSSRNKGLLSVILLVASLGACVAMLCIGLLHPWFTEVFSDRNGLYKEQGLFAMPLLVAEVFFLAMRSYSRSLRRTVVPMFLREFLLRVLQTALICVHIVVGLPFTAFMLLFALTFLLCTGFLAFDLWRSGERLVPLRDIRLPSRLKRSMVVFSFWTVAASVASVVLGSLDQMMIGALLGAEALRYVGYYAVAFNFGAVVSAPMRALSQLAIPILADAWKKKDHDAIQVIYVRSAAAQFTVGGFLFLVIWVDLSGLFTLLRPEFMAGYGAALVISATSLMNMAVGLNAGIITMSRHYRVDSITSALLLVLNVVLNWFFIRRWGIEGAAWSSFVSLAVVLIIRVAYLKKKFDLWPFTWRTLLVPVLIVGVGTPLHMLPSTGSALIDMVLITTIATVVFWPLVHWARLAPDITDRGVRFARRWTGRA
ncbi:MAG: polysaccharide biosynthesis protein [Flavobacteriales bacterium]|nr:MAG: polysaccharide biosynthesis protein [Flavobacteriales bacterium]